MSRVKRLAEERLSLVKSARDIIDRAEAEKRSMNTEERAEWDKIMQRVDELKAEIERAKRQEEEESEEAAQEEEEYQEEESPGENVDDEESDRQRSRVPSRDTRRTPPGGSVSPRLDRDVARRSSPEYRQLFWRWVRDGDSALRGREARAIQADADALGGYLVAPQQFTSTLIKAVDDLVFVRKYATKYVLKAAQTLGAPVLDSDVADADWTSELDTGNEDTSLAFGKRELTPHALAKRIRISNKLLRQGTITSVLSANEPTSVNGIESFVVSRLAYKFSVSEEKAFLTGSGVRQPLGMFVASTSGISTARDFTSGSTTGITADRLIAAKYNQKAQYWPRCRWLFHRNVLLLIRQLKDSFGQYLWVPGGLGGESDTLLGHPVDMSEYAPSTLTAGQYIGIFYDPSFYWIADADTMQVQRLVELYAASNETGIIARRELDGMPVLEEAFTRIKTNDS